MPGRLRAAALAACVVVLAACAGAPQSVELAPQSAAAVRTVAIVLPPEPRTYSVVNMGNPALAFTLVGGIFVAADQDDKQARLYEAMRIEKFSLKGMLASVLQRRLEAAGYRARVVDGAWEQRGAHILPRPDLVGGDLDAILVVVPLTTGFVSRGPGADYIPTVTVLARLFAADGHTELYRAFHASGWQPRAEHWRFSAATRSFGDFEAVMAKPAASAAALAQGADAVAASIVGDLHRP
jgi:hypothetical protein